MLTDHVSQGYVGYYVAESPGAVLVSSASGSGHDDLSQGKNFIAFRKSQISAVDTQGHRVREQCRVCGRFKL